MDDRVSHRFNVYRRERDLPVARGTIVDATLITKSRIRAKVKHTFGVMKQRFGFTKLRYKGLAKNAHHLFVTSRRRSW